MKDAATMETKIWKVEPESWFDQVDISEPDDYARYYVEQIVYEVVWVITTDGGIYVRDLRKGETIETVAAIYRERGTIDDACSLLRIMTPEEMAAEIGGATHCND
jgi:hypothetical protein